MISPWTRCFPHQAILIDHPCIERVCPSEKYITTDLGILFFFLLSSSYRPNLRFNAFNELDRLIRSSGVGRIGSRRFILIAIEFFNSRDESALMLSIQR